MRSEFAEKPATFVPFHIATRSGGPLAGLTVLVVEASKFSSETLRLLCLSSGARVRQANGVTAAMRHLRAYRPDIVITEMCLPDGEGASLITNLDKMNPRLSMILGMSAQADDRAKAIQAGADGFILKPFESVAIFQHAIKSALPPELQQWKPARVSDEQIAADGLMLMQDMAHGLALLANACEPRAIGYAATFITGVAAVADDTELHDSATALMVKIRSGKHDLNDIAPVQAMLQQRLDAGSATIPPQQLALGGQLH
ncbi:response regulator [Paracoccus onubensis]|uniref:response regulator n=1 Tax=Paracoccus onubensis TaxID=1675788 RepID=UPI00272FDB2B|nr:response regulator [Paracoccus onubensis]MDP0928414.1 response regulator [Paracoccus onubensis]